MFTGSIVWKGLVYSILMVMAKMSVATVVYSEYFLRKWLLYRKPPRGRRSEIETGEYVQSMPHAQALLIASAMVARGEIGFLIASLAQSSGTLSLQANGIE